LAKIESYGKAYGVLIEALAKFPRGIWQYRPASDQWSIHEIVVHIADSEANSYIRCRRFLAEPGQPLMAYDEKRWARELNYHAQDPDDALELFRWLRKRSYDLIIAAPDEVWDRQCFHPENGMMTMDDWLDTYARHIPEHVAQMEQVYESWRSGQEPVG
jgi:hypothetical protein